MTSTPDNPATASRRIPIAGPWITEHEVAAVADAVRTAWQENANLYHDRFEAAFAAYVGRRHAIALPSCTSAIHLALAALDIGPGDEVIVPDIAWIAVAAPISYVGATPVFADIDPVSWCLSPAALERCVTDRTRAVIVVDLYGNMPDMDAILALARRRDIAVIEDAAEALGAECGGRPAGAFGRVGVFSFHGSKTLTTGEGGMLVTDDAALHARCLALRDHGRPPGDRWFFNEEVAFKYKMSAMQAALGLAQLRRIDALVGRKRTIHRWYAEALADLRGVTLNTESAGTRSAYWMVTAIVDSTFGLTKRDLMSALGEAGIDTRPFFHPLSSLPAYEHLPQALAARERNATAYELSPRGVNLPSGLQLAPADVRHVCEVLQRCLEGAR